MPVPHIPTPLEELRQRPFSFYPPIVNVQHNEWIFRRAEWDEIRVMNTKTSEELWVPRRFLGGVSSIEEPVVIVGLLKELEYKEGVLVPHVRRIIEMPRAVNDVPWRAPSEPPPGRLAPVVGISVESEIEPSKTRPVLTAIAAGLLTCIVGMVLFRDSTLAARTRLFAAPSRVALPFTAADDYFSITSRIGFPVSDRTRPGPDGLEFHLLRYPSHSYILVLLGTDRDDGHYIGAFGRGGRVIHSVKLEGGQDSTLLLDSLRQF